MRNLVFILATIFLSKTLDSQNNIKTYNWSELSDVFPDTIYSISFQKEKINSLPPALKDFKNLKQLNLSKNRLTELPDFIENFVNLEVLNLDKNQFNHFPENILKLKNLKELYLSRNNLSELPDEIDQLYQLTKLDLWSTAITYFPQSLNNLKKLITVDLRGVTYGPTFINEITTSMNWVKFEYETPCKCVE